MRIIYPRFGVKYFKSAANLKEKECPVFSNETVLKTVINFQ
jgi:hypothetical protein